jgi:hemerythrin-like domain-containing protein
MARQAARDVLRYFDLAAPAHHEDEERHVLPLLRASGAGAANAALAERLHADHEAMAAAWAQARGGLATLAEGQPWTAENAERHFAHWRAFAALYDSHLEAEDRVAFPFAAANTDAAARREMGREMSQRRGVVPRALGG